MEINITTRQTFYFDSSSSASWVTGERYRSKFYFQGNGFAPYLVSSATLTQGTKSVNVTCLGKTSFYVPAYGRWSDQIYFLSFTLPGYFNLNITTTGDVPTITMSNAGDKATITESGPISRIKTYGTITGFPIDDPCTSLASWTKTELLGTATILDGYRFYVNKVEIGQTGAAVLEKQIASVLPSNFTIETDLLVDKFGDDLTIDGDGEGAVVALVFLTDQGHFGVHFSKNEVDYTASSSLNYVKYSFAAVEEVEENWKFNFKFISTTRYILSAYKNDVFYRQIEGEVYNPGASHGALLQIGALNLAVSKTIGYTEAHIKSLKIWTGGLENEGSDDDGEDIYELGNDAISVTQNGTITVSSQPSAGSTLTITIDGNAYTFTFVNVSTGADYEILIGGNTTLTAAGIATTLNNLFGALISATSSANVVTIKIYSDDSVTITSTSDGVTASIFLGVTLYYSDHLDGYLPTITAYGEATQRGVLGDIYGLLTFPKMTSTGEATRSGNIGNTYIPMMTSTGWVFEPAGNSTSTNAQKIALLLCGNDWMETFASMVIASGTWDEIALQAVKWVTDYITYTTDTGLDNWQDPIHTLYASAGDCEDGAFLTASLIRNMGVPYSNIRVYIGETLGVGHAWVMYRRTSDNQWVPLDWTAGTTYWNAITSIDSLTALYDSILTIQNKSLDSDDYAYGSAIEYITCSDVISLANGRAYSDSLDSSIYSATIANTFPSLLFNANSGGYIADNFPSLLFSSTGILSPISNIKTIFPALQFSATAIQGAISNLTLTSPLLRFSASGIISSIVSLATIFPSLIFKATGLVGDSAQITGSLPSLKFTATAHWTGSNTIDIDIPLILFSALARNSVILDADGQTITGGLALVMNTRNFAMTEYDNYGYNSLFEVDGKIFGTTSTGIHELTGDTDNGSPISWHFKTGKIDLEKDIKTKVRYAWLSYRPSGDLILTVDDGENQYEYDVESYKQIDNGVRIKLGKGLRNRFIQLELGNVNGESVVFDHLRLFSDPTKKKR